MNKGTFSCPYLFQEGGAESLLLYDVQAFFTGWQGYENSHFDVLDILICKPNNNENL